MHLNLWILGISGAAIGGIAVLSAAGTRLPGNNRGYAPEQPIDFSHRLHAGELQLDCAYCHHGARSSRHAGVPAASVCMNCHGQVSAGFDELATERALALEPDFAQAYWFLANIRFALGDAEAAVEPLERLLAYEGIPESIRTEAEDALAGLRAGS